MTSSVNRDAGAAAVGGASALALPPRVTLSEASAVARDMASRATSAGQGPMPLIIDAGGVDAFDSSAFAVMLDVVRKAKLAGRDVRVRGAPTSMVDLARLYGVDELLSFDD